MVKQTLFLTYVFLTYFDNFGVKNRIWFLQNTLMERHLSMAAGRCRSEYCSALTKYRRYAATNKGYRNKHGSGSGIIDNFHFLLFIYCYGWNLCQEGDFFMGMNNKVSKYEGISVSLCDRKKHSRRPRSTCVTFSN